jgi:hypothetical protein
MPAYSVTVRDTAVPLLRSIVGELQARSYLEPVGEAGVVALVDNFAEREAAPDAHRTAQGLGARPLGLYGDFARATSWSTTTGGVTLQVSHPAAGQRYHGGEIRPVNSKFLTIPARGEVYGKRARESGITLKFLWGRNGPYALAAADDYAKRITRGERAGQQRRTKTGEAGNVGREGVLYWLVRSVTQRGDPRVLPTMEQLGQRIVASLEGWLARIRGRGA